jgi:hypothetical protein
MSNSIPETMADEEIPYCIWHPEVAAEETYRRLAQKYPQMKYHVARACAVAGYTKLYDELDVLPEVHVAEEARHNGCLAIFKKITSNATKYSVMDDYARQVNITNPAPALLNGDTALRSSLDIKRKFREPHLVDEFDDDDYKELLDYFEQSGAIESLSGWDYFNITEDYNLDSYETPPIAKDQGTVTKLLYSPLPLDLPEIQKDLLILMAGWQGSIDRYSRLRRPFLIDKEEECIIHGIYHSPLFAKWWSTQQDIADNKWFLIRVACHARRIMSNDLSSITSETPRGELPDQIWFPQFAHWTTYKELSRRKPEMIPQVARACIVANYFGLFEVLNPSPTKELVLEAKMSRNTKFFEFLKEKITDPDMLEKGPEQSYRTSIPFADKLQDPYTAYALAARKPSPYTISIDPEHDPDIYCGTYVNVQAIELGVLAADAIPKMEGEDVYYDFSEAYVPDNWQQELEMTKGEDSERNTQ